ncbi:MAG: Gfo/Idh/MocA family protein [Actinomycetota bacterium]
MTPDASRTRIALIGAGTMGSLHARVIAQSPEADLACVVDPHRPAGEALADRFRAEWAPELDDPARFDAIVLAAPTPTHPEWSQRVLEAGVPLLVEKPIADDLESTTAVVEAARRRKVPLMCGLLERYNPAVRAAMRIVNEPVHILTVRHSPYAPRIATGVAHDLLIHDVDLVLRLARRSPGSVDARFAYCHPDSRAGAEDVADVILDFDNGLVASLSVSRVSQRKVRSLVVAEVDRLVEVDMVRQDVTVYRHVLNAALDGESDAGYRQQTIIDIPAIHDAREPLATQLECFLSLVRGEADPVEELDTLLPPHQVVDQAQRIATARTPAQIRD